MVNGPLVVSTCTTKVAGAVAFMVEGSSRFGPALVCASAAAPMANINMEEARKMFFMTSFMGRRHYSNSDSERLGQGLDPFVEGDLLSLAVVPPAAGREVSIRRSHNYELQVGRRGAVDLSRAARVVVAGDQEDFVHA